MLIKPAKFYKIRDVNIIHGFGIGLSIVVWDSLTWW
jgi:hypothetical protein